MIDKTTGTAEPGSPTNFALTSFPAWNSAHQRSRKVTPSPSRIVNATRFDHIHILDSPGYGSAIVNASPTIAKKTISWRLNLNTMTDKSYWQRYIKPYSVALTSGMSFMYVEHGFPIVNAAKLSSSTGWKKTTARLAQTNKSYWQRDMISSCTYSQQWNGFKAGFLHQQAGSDRGSIKVRSKEPRTLSPNGKTRQQADPNSSRQQEEASQQQAESSKQKTQKTAAAAAAVAAAAATGRRIQQEEERYCRSTSSQPERSVWHLQVWNYRTVQRHIWDVKTMQLRENR